MRSMINCLRVKYSWSAFAVLFFVGTVISNVSSKTTASEIKKPYNVRFLISDDLTYTALSCYGNDVCQTPNIDAIAATGTRFTRTYCQGTYCGPSRASFMSTPNRSYSLRANPRPMPKSARPRLRWSRTIMRSTTRRGSCQGKITAPVSRPMLSVRAAM